jgi:hypothetical protein
MADFFVRPNAAHGGTNAGTSYANAWQGWAAIAWASIAAGDTLFVCGAFSGATLAIGAHGGNSAARVIIRGDFATETGSMTFASGQFLTPRSHTEFRNITVTGASRCALISISLVNWWCENVVWNGGTNIIFQLGAATGLAHADLVFRGNTFNGGNATADPGSHAAISWFASTAAVGSGNTCTVSRVRIENNRFIGVNPTGNARGVIGFRSEQAINVASIVRDLSVTGNTFENCRGYALEALDGHSFGAASPQYGLFLGARVLNNRVINQAADATGILGGAFSLFGFEQSTTAGFGHNLVAGNFVDGAEGQAGGANICYGTSVVENNEFRRLRTNSIDACGVLIDIEARNCIVRNNVMADMPGRPGVFNTGCGVMILDAINTFVYGNQITGARCGLFFGNLTASRVNRVHNNTCLDCMEDGVFIAAGADKPGCVLRNNVFTARSSAAVSVDSETAGWTAENFNRFDTLFAAPVNHTLGANSATANLAPLLNGDGSLRVAPTTTLANLATDNPLALSGTYIQGVHLMNGRMRPGFCPVGAYQAVLPRQARSA